ncbi:MAG: mannose-1-phosphate guanylyltransferase [Muribaculaceae bacterium]|nr:mannose-1-phosphate guanylyltransferase [Bacteroides sp.]MDE6072122.1 mannose-1-phosphate guanylyltransferase [Muribaculaceae bacterium]
MTVNTHRYCVIMCGGIGTRFWPFSRTNMPKQFLDFFGTGRSLLQMTVDRILPLVDPSRIILVTNAAYSDIIREQLPDIDPKNILLEPARRNTAPCICWAAYHIHALDPEASMVVLPSDHLVLKEDAFRKTLEEGFDFVEDGDRLLTIGINPTGPSTGYGYIQRGKKVEDFPGICKVKSFTEKPNLELAKVFLATGEFVWNAGMFLWTAKGILKAFEKYGSETLAAFQPGEGKYGTAEETEFISQAFPTAPSISIDYAIMEKADNVYVKGAEFGWSDLGTWKALYEASPHGTEGNVTQNCKVLPYDCKDTIFAVKGDKIVVASGLHNYIVAENDNALLIYPIEEEQRIRHIVNDVRTRFGEDYV